MTMATGGYHLSTASSLLEPQKQAKHSRNGELKQFPFTSLLPSTRPYSEPPSFPIAPLFEFTLASSVSKDDAYNALRETGQDHKIPHSHRETPIQPNAIDPKELLNPKRFDISYRARDDKLSTSTSKPKFSSFSANPQFIFASANDHIERSASPELEGSGMGNLIERVHNVEKREDRPRKRQKKDDLGEEDETGRPKSVFTGGGKGGEIGDYMREKRKEGQRESGSTAAIVDLTLGWS